MEIVLLCVGKTSVGWVQVAEQLYLTRLKHYGKFHVEIIPDRKEWKRMSATERMHKEGEDILTKCKSSDQVYLLDERGNQQSSITFASFLQNQMNTGKKRLIFVIGGAFGFSDQVRQNVTSSLALSKMTFSHQMIRILALEQLYRAMTILKNEPYHNS